MPLRRVAAHLVQAANATGVPACVTVAATNGGDRWQPLAATTSVNGTRVLDVERRLSTEPATGTTPAPSSSSPVGAIVGGVIGGLGALRAAVLLG